MRLRWPLTATVLVLTGEHVVGLYYPNCDAKELEAAANALNNVLNEAEKYGFKRDDKNQPKQYTAEQKRSLKKGVSMCEKDYPVAEQELAEAVKYAMENFNLHDEDMVDAPTLKTNKRRKVPGIEKLFENVLNIPVETRQQVVELWGKKLSIALGKFAKWTVAKIENAQKTFEDTQKNAKEEMPSQEFKKTYLGFLGGLEGEPDEHITEWIEKFKEDYPQAFDEEVFEESDLENMKTSLRAIQREWINLNNRFLENLKFDDTLNNEDNYDIKPKKYFFGRSIGEFAAWAFKTLGNIELNQFKADKSIGVQKKLQRAVMAMARRPRQWQIRLKEMLDELKGTRKNLFENIAKGSELDDELRSHRKRGTSSLKKIFKLVKKLVGR